jgi:hypothetical protein
MDHPLGDALVVEVEDLLTQHEVLEQRRTRCARAQAVLVVRDGDALGGGKLLAAFGVLVVLSPASLRTELLLGTLLLRPLLVRHAEFPLFLIWPEPRSVRRPTRLPCGSFLVRGQVGTNVIGRPHAAPFIDGQGASRRQIKQRSGCSEVSVASCDVEV